MAHPVRSFGARARRGFTLMESLMAASILLAVVLSVTTVITAGQQHAFEAHTRIAGTLAAEELIGRLTAENYDALPTWNGYNEPIGTMVDGSGAPFPASFAMIGRDVTVTTLVLEIASPSVNVRGRNVKVRSFNSAGRILAELNRFIPEPPEDSIP